MQKKIDKVSDCLKDLKKCDYRTLENYLLPLSNLIKEHSINSSNHTRTEKNFRTKELFLNTQLESIAILDNMFRAFYASDYLKVLAKNHNRNLNAQCSKSGYNKDCSASNTPFFINVRANNYEEIFKEELSRESNSTINYDKLCKKSFFWINRLAKIFEAISTDKYCSLFGGYNQDSTISDISNLYASSLQHGIKLNATDMNDLLEYISSDNFVIPKKRADKFDKILDFIKDYGIETNPKNVNSFMTLLLSKQNVEHLYNIKSNNIKQLLFYQKLCKKKESFCSRVFKIKDSSSSNKIKGKSSYRIVLFSKGDFAPTIGHIPTKLLNEFCNENKIDLDCISPDDKKYEFIHTISPFNFELTQKMREDIQKRPNFLSQSFIDYYNLEEVNPKEEVKSKKEITKTSDTIERGTKKDEKLR